MKKSVLFAFILIIMTNFVSAQNSLSDLLNEIDQSTVIFFAIFLISFSLLFFALNKVFKKQNTTASGIISLAISFLIIYGLNKSEFDIGNYLYDFGINSNVLYTLLPIVIGAAIIFLLIRFKEKALYIIGAALLVIGLYILRNVTATIILVAIIVLFAFVIRSVLKFLGISLGKGSGKTMSHREAVRRYADAGAGI